MDYINEQCMATFRAIYAKHLKTQVALRPSEYRFGPDDVPSVVEKMMAAVRRQSFNKAGRAFAATCRELKIDNTYKGIREYLCGSDIARDILASMNELGFVSSRPNKNRKPRQEPTDHTGTLNDQHADAQHERFTQ